MLHLKLLPLFLALVTLPVVESSAAPSVAAEESFAPSVSAGGVSKAVQAPAAGRRRGKSIPGFSGSFGVMQNSGIQARMGSTTHFRAELVYGFLDKYSAGVSSAYRRPFGDLDPDFNGWGDVTFMLGVDEIFRDEDWRFKISGDVSYIMPQSARSQRRTLENAFQASMKMRKGFGSIFALIYGLEIGRYFHEYDTNPSGTRFNTPYAWESSLKLSANVTDTVRSSIGVAWKTAVDYNARTDHSGEQEVGLIAEWQALQAIAFSGGIKSLVRGGAGDEGGEGEGDGEGRPRDENTEGRRLFDASTSAFVFGVAYRF